MSTRPKRRRRLSSITRSALSQGDWRARPTLAGSEKRGECNLIVLDAGDVLDNALAVRSPGIDAEGEVSFRFGRRVLFRLPLHRWHSDGASTQRRGGASGCVIR